MRTGVAYLGHHNRRHMQTDLKEMHELGCDDVLLAAQEIDFHYFPGKLRELPDIAKDLGMRPIAIFWGALNLFGGGRSSQFLLDHPVCHQVGKDGSWNAAACYNNPQCIALLQHMIDQIAELGYAGYFIDEPAPLDCHCDACCKLFAGHFGGDLRSANDDVVSRFRHQCVTDYVRELAGYVKSNYRSIETFCCMPPEHRELWREVAEIEALDNLGADLYWANDGRDLQEMKPLISELHAICQQRGKKHHEWLQCWGVDEGNEARIGEMGDILLREQPDALYAWAFAGQIGTNETCADPATAWREACRVIGKASLNLSNTHTPHKT